MTGEPPRPPPDLEPPPGFGYWHGSMGGLVDYWRERALRAEAEAAELRKELMEAVVHGRR